MAGICEVRRRRKRRHRAQHGRVPRTPPNHAADTTAAAAGGSRAGHGAHMRRDRPLRTDSQSARGREIPMVRSPLASSRRRRFSPSLRRRRFPRIEVRLMSFRSYVVGASFDWRQRARRLHVRDVKLQRPQGLTAPTSHKRRQAAVRAAHHAAAQEPAGRSRTSAAHRYLCRSAIGLAPVRAPLPASCALPAARRDGPALARLPMSGSGSLRARFTPAFAAASRPPVSSQTGGGSVGQLAVECCALCPAGSVPVTAALAVAGWLGRSVRRDRRSCQAAAAMRRWRAVCLSGS